MKCSGLVYTLLLIFITTAAVYSESEEEFFFTETIESEELIDPHSFYYDRINKKIIKDVDNSPSQIAVEKHTKHESRITQSGCPENSNAQDRIFYKRLVNLILSNIQIQIKNNDIVAGVLSIQVSHSQMKQLQDFHIENASLREIDAILSTAIKEPEFIFKTTVMQNVEIFSEILFATLRFLHEYRDAVLVIAGSVIAFIILKKLFWGRRLPILLTVQVLLVLSFFMTWWQLMQEEEIKLMAAQRQLSEIPIACQPEKMNMWHKFVATVFPNNDCEKYYEALMTNPKLKVTPAIVFSHFLSTAVLHPITNLGHVISKFIENATDGLPWTYGWMVKLVLFLSIGLVIIILPFVLFGASINLGLGPLFKFGIDCRKKSKKGNFSEDAEKRVPVQVILQLPQGNASQVTAKIADGEDTKIIHYLTNTEQQKGKLNEEVNAEECKSALMLKDATSEVSTIDSELEDTCKGCNIRRRKEEIGSGDS